jgi:glycosyltransferase involved in cell wall biosynthesis
MATAELAAPLSSAAEPLRIALCGYRSNPFSGGQGVYIKYLSRALAAMGHQVDVISGEPYPELDAGVNLVPLPGLNLYAAENHLTALRAKHLASATDLFEWASMATGGFPEPYTFGRRLQAHLAGNRTRYDVIHDNQCLASGLLKLQTQGFALTNTIHHPITWDRDIALAHASSLVERVGIRRWHHFLRMQKRVARNLRHIVTVSESARRDIARAFAIPEDRITVVPNGIDTDEFQPLPGVMRKPRQIITTASADQPLKGTQHLIPAIARLVGEFADLKVVFIGRPKPGGKTERLIDAAGLWPHIEVHTGISNAALVRLYAESSVCVVPSEYEGFGLPAGEAMACGVPVVSTDGGALPEVVGDAGLVVPARSADALAQGLAELLRNDTRRRALAEAGRARVHALFSWERAAERMTAHYRTVML